MEYHRTRIRILLSNRSKIRERILHSENYGIEVLPALRLVYSLQQVLFLDNPIGRQRHLCPFLRLGRSSDPHIEPIHKL